MVPAWKIRKWPNCWFALVLSISLIAPLTGAQEPAKRLLAPSPRMIILPTKAIAGAQTTLAVLDAQGRLLPHVIVELSGTQKVTTDATGRALFNAPGEAGTLTAKTSDHRITASTPLLPSQTSDTVAPSKDDPQEAKVSLYPHVLAIHDRFTLEGSRFRGAADSNRVYLADDPCLVLASSPVSLVVLPGAHVPIGAVNLRIAVAGHDAAIFSVSAVLLDFSGPEDAANVGSSGRLILRAHGTTERLAVEVRNGSPDVIQFTKGNVQRLWTPGGDENIVPFSVKFVASGNYVVSARLVSTEAGAPDLELARKRLMEARKISPADWASRIDEVLVKIDQRPQDLTQVRAKLKTMLDDKPPASLASVLESAWRELN